MRLPRTPFVLLALVSFAGCSIHGLSIKQDTRFRWVNPEAGEVVRLPVEIRWEMTDFDGAFAIFVDASPMRPGRHLSDLVPERDPCHREPQCPNSEWLADHGIFVTKEHSIVIQELRDGSGSRSDRDNKELTVVLLDDSGQRMNETAFVREFTVDRSGEP